MYALTKMYLLNSFEFVTSCLSTPCLNDGKCLDTMSGHRCECISPFHGPFCQFHKESWTYHWSIVELVLFLLVVFLIICAIAMICCSTNMGVYVTVPNKRYNRWDEEELSDENDDEDVIALGDLKKIGMRPSRTRETMLDPEAGCANPCLDSSSVVML
ncbi:unnamed protein product [Auanema sp. JU1783]|nr:unnamed protein product [Auanema sp. JU1783]